MGTIRQGAVAVVPVFVCVVHRMAFAVGDAACIISAGGGVIGIAFLSFVMRRKICYEAPRHGQRGVLNSI